MIFQPGDRRRKMLVRIAVRPKFAADRTGRLTLQTGLRPAASVGLRLGFEKLV
jgi:hypothetical protein